MELPKLDFTSNSAAKGGTTLTPWYQGDVVVSFAGDARSGDRTAPPPLPGITPDGGVLPSSIVAGGLGSNAALIAGAILLGAILWKLSR